jgi:hypothetical protein
MPLTLGITLTEKSVLPLQRFKLRPRVRESLARFFARITGAVTADLWFVAHIVSYLWSL